MNSWGDRNMKNKKKILFFAEGTTFARIARPLELAVGVNKDEFEVLFACPRKYQNLAAENGLQYVLINSLPSEVFLKRVSRAILPLFKKQELERSIAEDLELIRKIKPSVVVGDFRHSLLFSSKLAGVPYVNLANSYWSGKARLKRAVPAGWWLKVLGVKFSQFMFERAYQLIKKIHACPFRKIARKLVPNLKITSIDDVYLGGDYVLYLDDPNVVHLQDKPQNHFFIGVSNPRLSETEDAELAVALEKPGKKIFLALGSSGDHQMFLKIVDALKETDATVFVATGDKLAPNFFVRKNFPLQMLLQKIDLFISHGGSSTSFLAAKYAVPILAFPSNIDHFLSVGVLEQHGVCHWLRLAEIGKAQIAEKIAILLDENVKKESLQLAERMMAGSASENFNQFLLENLA